MKTTVKSLMKFALLPVMMVLAINLQAQTMSVAPDMINLNTQGNYENIQCIYGGYLPSANIINHSIAVTFAGSYITQACAVVYCPVDNNIFIEIDRVTFQNHPAVQAMANLGSQVLSVVGTFTVQLSTGATQEFVVDRWGYAQIIRPGQKK